MATRAILKHCCSLKAISPLWRKTANGIENTARLRQMSTAAARNYTAEESNALETGERRRRERPSRQTDLNSLLNDVWSPFLPATVSSLSQAMDAMNFLFDSPGFRGLASGPSAGSREGVRVPWDAKEDDEAFRLRLDMPGLGKEDVKLNVEDNVLVISGEGESEEVKCNSRVRLPGDVFDVNAIKAEMKNGVLKITVPKIQKQENKTVINVNVD